MENDVCNCGDCQHKLCARRVPIFSTLDSAQLDKLAALIKKRKYEKNEMILMEGNTSENLIIIEKGQVKVFRYTQEGKEQILYIFSEGDFFGEKNLLKKHETTYNVEAIEPTHVCMINKTDFQKLLLEYPEIGLKIIEELGNRMDRLESSIQSMGTRSIESRINGVLLDFASRYGRQHSRGVLVELPLSREGIANYIGTARETVSRKLSLLQDEGILEMIGNKKIVILNMKALED